MSPVLIHKHSPNVGFWCVYLRFVWLKGFFSGKHLARCCVLSANINFRTFMNVCIIYYVHRMPVLSARHCLNSKEKSTCLAQCGAEVHSQS